MAEVDEDDVGGHSSRSASSSGEIPRTTSVTSHKRRAGRKKFRETRHPLYRGVRARNGGKWVCEVREPRKKSRVWVGTFPCPEMAARAHDVAALALSGDRAALNFEDSRRVDLPRPASSLPRDIRAAARAAAAQAFRPHVSKANEPAPPHVSTAATTHEFHDEEAECNMPSLLSSMAEGMLITPPGVHKGFDWDNDVEDCPMDLSLWND